MTATLESNVFDTALIFEGGGMRASYTSAIANALLEEGIYFDHVYGVSAGSSLTVNYLSRDKWRMKASFTDLVLDPNFGSMKTLLAHKGYFNARYIYEEAGLPDGTLPFDFETFTANPAKASICGFERDTGRTRVWTKADMPTTQDLMRRVRASSTLPIIMPPTRIDGNVCYDGGLAAGNGIMLPQAQADGFEKFFIVRTRPKPFRKPERPGALTRAMLWRRPKMQQALDAWGPGYNDVCDQCDALAQQGRAFVVYAEDMEVENSTTDIDALKRSYERGAAQAERDMPRWKEFLGL